MKPFQPVLLLGPGRGGTTLLYKLLALHRDAAFVSNFDTRKITGFATYPLLRLSKWNPKVRRLAWFSREGQAYLANRTLLQRLIPMPVEGEILYASCGLSLEENRKPADAQTRAALRQTFAAVQLRHRGKVLLLKRTANNRRIPTLDSAFPERKMVILWRDGRAVAASLVKVHWWLDHPVWWAGGKTPRQMNLNRKQSIEVAARNWIEEVQAIERGLAHTRLQQVIQVKYEQLLAQPRQTLSSVLSFIGLQVSEEYLQQLDSLKLGPPTETWRESLSDAEIEAVEKIGRAQLQKLSYL